MPLKFFTINCISLDEKYFKKPIEDVASARPALQRKFVSQEECPTNSARLAFH